MLATIRSAEVTFVEAWVAAVAADCALVPASVACWSARFTFSEANCNPFCERPSTSLILFAFSAVISSSSLTRSRIGTVYRSTYFLLANGCVTRFARFGSSPSQKFVALGAVRGSRSLCVAWLAAVDTEELVLLSCAHALSANAMQKIIDRNMQFFISNLPLSSPNALNPTGLLSRLPIVPVDAQIRRGQALECNFYSTTPAPNEVILFTAPRWLSFATSLARTALLMTCLDVTESLPL